MSNKTKTCFKCGIEKNLEDFYKHKEMSDGHINKCKECTKIDTKTNYKKNINHYKQYDLERNKTEKRKKQQRTYTKKKRTKYPEKDRANRILNYHVRVGNITKYPCQECGTQENIDAHHEDYSKPLDVIWLCRQCHINLHHSRK